MTPPVQLQNPGKRAPAHPSGRPPPALSRAVRSARFGRIQCGALRPVEWASKLAERPSTMSDKSVSPNTSVRRETALLSCALTQAHAQELPDAPDRC
jgi:hypothetical protein